MKHLLFLTCIALWMLCNTELIGQKVHWINKLDVTSSGSCIERTKDGNFLIGGQFSYKIMIASFDKDGNKLWDRNICDTCSKYSSIIFSKELEDRRILLISNTPYLFITDSTGLDIDTLIYIGASTGYYENINKVVYFNNELIISSSYDNGNGIYGSILSRFSIPQLKITYRQKRKQSSSIEQIAILEDSSLIICQSNWPYYNLQKLNSLNQIVWEKAIQKEKFTINDLIVSRDQRILILGDQDTTDLTNAIILALNTKGDSLWQNEYYYNPQHKSGWSFNTFNKIKETREGDFVLVGLIGSWSPFFSPFDLDILKINTQGEFIWEQIQWIIGEGTMGTDLLFDEDQNIVVVGTTGLTDYGGPERAFIMKLSNPLVSTKNQDFVKTILFPNPCNDKLTINNQNNQIIDKIELYNMEGKYIMNLFVNDSKFTLNTSELNSGIYFCKLFTKQVQIVRKFCKL